MLRRLCDANRCLGFYREGIQQAREALDICEELGDAAEQASSLNYLAYALFGEGQLDAAETAALRATDLIPEKGHEYLVCKSRRFLGYIYQSGGKNEKAVHHFNTALVTASPFKWRDELFWIHIALAELFDDESKFPDANAHVQQAKLNTADDVYELGYAMEVQAGIWGNQHKFEDARSEALRVLKIFEKLGAAYDTERCRGFIQTSNEQ